MKNIFLTLSLALGLSLTVTFPAHAGWEVLKPANLWERLVKEVAKQDIGASVNLVNGDIVNGLSTSLGYRIESEPSYVDGYYTRIDKYTLKFGLNPGDFIEALDTPIGINLEKGSEIIFARQFKNQKDSLLALPYTPRNLPFTAKNALERLQPGDFVAFQGKLSLVLSLSQNFLKWDFRAGASTHVYLSGEFMVHIFRMPQDKIRVKLIAIRERGAGANAGIGLDKFEVLGLGIVDNRIEKWLNIVPLDLRTGTGKNDVIMLDYVFDLNNSQAVQAYDSLMLHKVQLKDIKIANPTASRTDLTQDLLTDLSDVEQIALEDSLLPPQERRIDRIFKGSSEGVGNDSRIKFGLNLWKFEAGRAYGENKVLSYDKQDNEQYFLLDTLSRYKKTKILFGLFGEETLLTSNLLFTSDKDWTPKRFVTLTSSAEMKMKDVSSQDLKEIQRLVQDTIGAGQYQNIDWSSWEASTDKKVNGYFKQEVFFNPDALSVLPYLSPESVEARFKQYLQEKGRPRSIPVFGTNSPISVIFNWVSAFTGDIHRIAEHLNVVINPNKSVQERFSAFEDLQQIPIWRERGIGFLMSFISEDKRTQLLRYEMVLSAKGVAPVQYSYGQFSEEKLYRALMYIQNVIQNRSFDLRLFTDENGEFRTTSQAPAPLL